MTVADTYRVLAPYITVKVRTDKGVQAVGLYEGALLPVGVLDESIQHHLGKKHLGKPMIEKFSGMAPALAEVQLPADPAPDPEPDPAPEPVGEAADPFTETPAPPPTTGPGSGQKAWAEYAVALGYAHDDVATMSRDDIINLTSEVDD